METDLTYSIPELIKQHFPQLMDQDLMNKIEANGIVRDFEEGDVIIDYGSYIKIMPLVVSGSIRILKQDHEGHELFLYYLNPGDTCAMSLTCCMAESPSEVKAIAEEDTRIIALPARFMYDWLNEFTLWKNFVLQTYSKRFNELLSTVDSIAFSKMDERLIRYLREKQKSTGKELLHVSHQEIARELGTHREVISRLLKKLEHSEKVELGRNKIRVLNLDI